MPQMQFPIFPEGMTHINDGLAFARRDDRVTYYDGSGPIADHAVDDLQTFRMVTAKFCVLGLAKQAEVAQACGVTSQSVLRSVKRYRTIGPAGFYAPRRTRGPAVLTPEVRAEAQALLDQHVEVGKIARRLNLKPNTLAKAIRDGRLQKPSSQPQDQPEASKPTPSSKSHRSCQDSTAPMGQGATNTLERVAASVGQLSSAPVQFQAALDVPNGGVLLALPALLTLGLLRHTSKRFELPKGYYGLTSIFLLIAFMALARLKSVEALRYCSPGEWGKLLGLDRAPEVRTLRTKLDHLSQAGEPAEWSADLRKDWMKAQPEQATAFYIDGHVRVYNGKQTKLPRRYVSRQKLCLRACTDYWVNAMDGQPFFVVYQDVDPGLIKVLQDEILPRLAEEAPNQPSKAELKAKALLHRFTLVFDREGYSPQLMKELKEQRIACLTYRKKPGDDWPESEFDNHNVALVSGNVVEMRLAERGSLLGSSNTDRIWVREVRRLLPDGHQTSIVATDYTSDLTRVAASMFARWCQENFFKYMQENYGIDRLVSYQTENLPDGTRVVNPEHRRLESAIRSKRALLGRKTSELGSLDLALEDQSPAEVEKQLQTKADLHEAVTLLQAEIDELKVQRKGTPRHIPLGELPEGERFKGLAKGTKQLLDTAKMVAYRAETAMVQVVRERMSRTDDARSFLRSLYATEVDLHPDYAANVLLVKVHTQANRSADEALSHLCREMTETETRFPGTDLRLVYELVTDRESSALPTGDPDSQSNEGEQNPRDQEV